MKKFFSILMVLSVLFSLCACGGNAATETTAPATETVAPTTEPVPETTEALSECELNGHSWVEANYQAPKTCSVCGEVEGEALTASFVEHNLAINITELGTEYDYVTTCSSDKTKQTVGKLSLSNYRVFEGDETHPALDGYEWHAVSVTIRFNDENANAYGMGVNTCRENYYDVVGWDESQSYLKEEKLFQSTVNYNGVDYTECLYDDSCVMNFSEWVDKECVVTFDRYIRVPVGYDGIVLGFYDYGIEWGEGQHIYDIADENTLFFRLDGIGAEYTE